MATGPERDGAEPTATHTETDGHATPESFAAAGISSFAQRLPPSWVTRAMPASRPAFCPTATQNDGEGQLMAVRSLEE
jgi:hypothetical protein